MTKGKLQRQREENRALQRIRMSNKSGSHVGCFRYHRNNSDAHERMKFEVYKERMDMGHAVITEAIFKNGRRGDVVDLTTQTIIEILCSETEEEAREKTKDYPAGFTVEYIHAKEEDHE